MISIELWIYVMTPCIPFMLMGPDYGMVILKILYPQCQSILTPLPTFVLWNHNSLNNSNALTQSLKEYEKQTIEYLYFHCLHQRTRSKKQSLDAFNFSSKRILLLIFLPFLHFSSGLHTIFCVTNRQLCHKNRQSLFNLIHLEIAHSTRSNQRIKESFPL